VEHAVNPIPKKSFLNITQSEPIVKIDFEKKVFGRENLVNEF
jgi:hypothetical protein